MNKILNPVVAWAVLSCFLISPVHAQKGKALQTIFRILVGTAAAKALANAAEADSIEADKEAVVQRLMSKGVDLRDGAIFSTYFSLNNNADAVYWADLASKPDIYLLVSIEGHGDFLIPKYVSEYAGQPILENIIAKKIEPGRKIVVYVLDEDTTSDAIWNSVLQTKVSFDIGSNISVCQPISISVGASGTVQVIGSHVTLDSPEFIAVAEFIVPDTEETVWVADGILRDEYSREVGRIQFSQIWKADPAQIDAAEADVISSRESKVFWFGLSAVLVLVFGKMFFTSNTKSA